MRNALYTIVALPRAIRESILNAPGGASLTAGGTTALKFNSTGGKEITAEAIERVTDIRRYAGKYLVLVSSTGFTRDAQEFAEQYEDVLLVAKKGQSYEPVP